MGKSAKFLKRPTRKEKNILSLTKGSNETSLFDSVNNNNNNNNNNNTKKDILSATANPTISKKSSKGSAGSAGSVFPPKASLAYKMQLNGGVKQAVKDIQSLDDEDDEMGAEEDDDMGDDDNNSNKKTSNKKDLDKTKPRADYIELMYGKPQTGNKRKSFMPKPALIK